MAQPSLDRPLDRSHEIDRTYLSGGRTYVVCTCGTEYCTLFDSECPTASSERDVAAQQYDASLRRYAHVLATARLVSESRG